jgi:hypothetical protein
MSKKVIVVFLCTIFISLAHAQLKYNRLDSIVVTNNLDTLDLAFVGGLNNPQFSEIDLNFDGLNDLFIYEKDGGTIKTFINKGIAGESSYEYTNEYQFSFPTIKNFALLRDYNCDGKMDLFTGTVAGIKVYKNISSPALGIQFQLETSLLMSDYNPDYINLYIPSTDIPVIDDLDNDGDLDILTFGVVGSTVEYHKNLSMDIYGICDSLTYNRNSSCWGDFAENAGDNGVSLNINCDGNRINTAADNEAQRASRHSGSTLLTIDLDGDGDKEFIAGDVSFSNLVMLTNRGDSAEAYMTNQMSTFPLPSHPADVSIFPAAFYLDINNDSIKDLLIAPTAKNVSENTESVWLYTNSNKTDFPSFSFASTNFLQSEMIEVGSGANPIFFDANADGLFDILIGNYGYYDKSANILKSKLTLLTNTGTDNTPSFEVTTDNYQNISAIEQKGIYPAIGDMDNDGDEDLILGTDQGELFYYTNTAGAGNVATFNLSVSKYMDIDVGYFSTPFIVDYNKDGLNDLIIGSKNGTLEYYENTGTLSAASFSTTPTIDTLAGINVKEICCSNAGYSNVSAYFNNNETLTLNVGSIGGIIYQYTSTDNTLATYNLIDSIITDGVRVNASLADIDNNGIPELVTGHYAGGINMYSKTSNLRLIQPLNQTENLNDTLTLDWSSVESTDYYQLVVDTSYNFNSTLLLDSTIQFISNEGGGLDNELSISSLLNSTTYYWRTRLIAENDTTEWTPTWSFKTAIAGDNDLNGEIGDNEITGDTNGNGVIDENETEGDANGNGTIDSEDVGGDTNGNGTIDNAEVAGDTNENGTIDNTEIAGDTNGNGIIDDSEVTGDIDGNGVIDNQEVLGDKNGNGVLDSSEISNTTDLIDKNVVSIYPNPTNGTLNIVNNQGISNFALVNLQGQLVFSSKLVEQHNIVDINTIANGIYFGIITSSNGETQSFKVIKD